MKLKHLSWSQMNLLAKCGEQYRRRYVIGEKLPPGIAMLRGRSIHKANEANLVHKMRHGALLEVDDVKQRAVDELSGSVSAGDFVVDGDYAEMGIKDAISRAKDEAVDLAGLHAEEIAPAIEPDAIEVRIELPSSEILPVPFVSILDLVDKAEGDVMIRDTKTTAKAPPRNAADTSDQLTSQDLAYRARYGQPPHGLSLDYLIRTRNGGIKKDRLETQRTDSDLWTFLQRANAARKMIEAEVFLPTSQDNWACSVKWCGYAPTCPYFRGRRRPTT